MSFSQHNIPITPNVKRLNKRLTDIKVLSIETSCSPHSAVDGSCRNSIMSCRRCNEIMV